MAAAVARAGTTAIILALFLSLFVEWKIYRELLIFDNVNIDGRLGGMWLKLSILGFIWAKTAAIFAAALLFFIVFYRARYRRLATVLMYGSLLLGSLWIVLNARVYEMFGNHLSFYLEWASDTKNWTLAGDPSTIAATVASWCFSAVICFWLLYVVVGYLA